jgi:hypothetical protein
MEQAGDAADRPKPLAAADRGIAHRFVSRATRRPGTGRRGRTARPILLGRSSVAVERGACHRGRNSGRVERSGASGFGRRGLIWIFSIRACAADAAPRIAGAGRIALAVKLDRLVQRGIAAFEARTISSSRFSAASKESSEMASG